MTDREDLARRLSTAVSVAISEALATREQTQQIPVRTFFYFAFLIALYQERKKTLCSQNVFLLCLGCQPRASVMALDAAMDSPLAGESLSAIFSELPA